MTVARWVINNKSERELLSINMILNATNELVNFLSIYWVVFVSFFLVFLEAFYCLSEEPFNSIDASFLGNRRNFEIKFWNGYSCELAFHDAPVQCQCVEDFQCAFNSVFAKFATKLHFSILVPAEIA
jgi:hypothetical protein